MPGHKEIPLRNRAGEVVAVALVDAEDYDRIAAHRWCWDGRYPRRNVLHASGLQESVRMHREVLGLRRGDPRQGDHRDGNRLDNRRANLRILPSQAAQVQNVAAHRDSRSGIRGVVWDRERGCWQARVGFNGKNRYLGRFDDPEEAGRVAAAFRAEHLPFAAR